jgi:hypothetical protein
LAAIQRNDVVSVFSKILASVVGILLFSYFVSMGLGLFLLYALPQGLSNASKQVTELTVSAFMIVNFSIPLGVSVGFFFMMIWLLYLGSFALAWFDRPGFLSSFRDFVTRFDMFRSNYLVLLPQLAPVVLVAVVLLQTLQESAGVQTGGISFESPILSFLAVSYAPLVEEFSYRITTIGLLDGLHLVWKRVRLPPTEGRKGAAHVLMLTMWKPERAKELLGFNTIQKAGVTRGISRFEWLLLVVTSGAFGAVHYLAGGGWEIGKISTATLSGLVMGFVYLRYGAYAPILLHWFFNYYFGAFDLASQLNLAGASSIAFGVELLNMGVGILLVVVVIGAYLVRVWPFKHRRKESQPEYVGESPNVS